MREAEPPGQFHCDICGESLRDVFDFQFDAAQLRKQALAADQDWKLWFFVVGVERPLCLEPGLQLKFFTAPQFGNAPYHAALRFVPHSTRRLSH